MKNAQTGSVTLILLVIIAVLVIGGGIYVYKNEKTAPIPSVTIQPNVANETPIENKIVVTPEVSESKAKLFVEMMQKDLGTSYEVRNSSRQIGFPRTPYDSGPSNLKTLKGYSFYYTGGAIYSNYMMSKIGPAPGWLASEREMGYINKDIICIQSDGSSGNAYIPKHSSEVFCADLN